MLYKVQIISEPGHINFVILAVFYGFMRGLVGFMSKFKVAVIDEWSLRKSVGMIDLMNGQSSEVMNRSRVWPNL